MLQLIDKLSKNCLRQNEIIVQIFAKLHTFPYFFSIVRNVLYSIHSSLHFILSLYSQDLSILSISILIAVKFCMHIRI